MHDKHPLTSDQPWNAFQRNRISASNGVGNERELSELNPIIARLQNNKVAFNDVMFTSLRKELAHKLPFVVCKANKEYQ